MIEATFREANELYTFFTLLSHGTVFFGDGTGKPGAEAPIAAIRRMEHDGQRLYYVGDTDVRVVGEGMDETFPREDFGAAALYILERMGDSDDVVDISDLEGFLDAVRIYDMEARTDDTTDLHVALYDVNAPFIGVRIQSLLCGTTPLLDGGRSANIKFEQTGIRFSSPAVHKINWVEDPTNIAEVARRILYVQSMGGILKYSDVADRVFRSNLLMIDTNLPRIVASMLMALHLDGVARMQPLVEMLEERNPLKVKDELIRKHGFYEHKVRQLLLASAWGMRPAKQYTGRQGAVGGYLVVDARGGIVMYSRGDEQTFSDWLYSHARLEKALPEDAKYGLLERENGAYYIKLNLKIGLKP